MSIKDDTQQLVELVSLLSSKILSEATPSNNPAEFEIATGFQRMATNAEYRMTKQGQEKFQTMPYKPT